MHQGRYMWMCNQHMVVYWIIAPKKKLYMIICHKFLVDDSAYTGIMEVTNSNANLKTLRSLGRRHVPFQFAANVPWGKVGKCLESCRGEIYCQCGRKKTLGKFTPTQTWKPFSPQTSRPYLVNAQLLPLIAKVVLFPTSPWPPNNGSVRLIWHCVYFLNRKKRGGDRSPTAMTCQGNHH